MERPNKDNKEMKEELKKMIIQIVSSSLVGLTHLSEE